MSRFRHVCVPFVLITVDKTDEGTALSRWWATHVEIQWVPSSSSFVPLGLELNSHTSPSFSNPLTGPHPRSVLFCNLQLLLLAFKTPFHFLLWGRHCETFVDVCPQMPCLNGGTCAVASNMPDGFICRCPPVSAVLPIEGGCSLPHSLWRSWD